MKDIEGYEGVYAVTEDGRVWSHPRLCIGGQKRQPIGGRFMKIHQVAPNRTNHSYSYVDLYKGCKRKREYLHRLVAKAFIPNPLNLPEVNHKNYDRTDNSIFNLEWMSKIDNMRHGLLKRKTALGEDASRTKLKTSQILEIRRLATNGTSRYELATNFQMSYSGIKAIIKRETWKHI